MYINQRPSWLSWQSMQLLILGSWVWAPRWGRYCFKKMYKNGIIQQVIFWDFFPSFSLTIMSKVAMEIYVGFYVNISFRFFGINAQECKCWNIWYLHILFKRLPNCFPDWLGPFISPLATYEWSSFSPSSPSFGGITVFYFNHLVGI